MVTAISRVTVAMAFVATLAGCGKLADEQRIPAPAPTGTAAVAPESFALGIVDALQLQVPLRIEPLAHFTGTDWIHGWPSPDDAGLPYPTLQDVPDAWLGGPVPRTWALWLGGSAPINVTVTGTSRDKGGCSMPILLNLDKRPADLGLSEIHGLAVSTTQVVRAMHVVGPSDEERRDVLAAATAALIEQRRKAIADSHMSDEERNALSDARLAQVPVTLDYVYRPATTERDIYFFQVDQWTKPNDTEAPHISVWGWLRRDGAGRFQPMGVEAHAGSEDGMLPRQLLVPLGVIDVRGRTFWIVQGFGLESTAFGIYEVAPGEIRPILTGIGGGGC